MFRPEFPSRRALLAATRGLVLSGGPLPLGGRLGFCSDPPGRDVLLTPAEVLHLVCGDCKKHCVLAARRVIDERATRGLPGKVELCCTVSDDPEEHMFLRVDGEIRDPAQEAGMPVREVGAFIAETVWEVPPGPV